jgi:hypothetical protein
MFILEKCSALLERVLNLYLKIIHPVLEIPPYSAVYWPCNYVKTVT